MELSKSCDEKIRKYRDNNVDGIVEAFKSYCSLPFSSNLIINIQSYSTAYHILLKIYWLYKENCTFYDEMLVFLHILSSRLSSFDNHRYYVVKHEACTRIDSELFDSYIYLLNINDIKQSEQNFPIINDAVDLGIKLGFSELILKNLGVIIILEKKSGYEPSNSYTVSTLPGTIFMDLYDNVFKVCEMIVHECSHIHLNDILYSNEEYFDNSIMYWSVWKKKYRPIMGIIHAAYAFSNVILYYKQLLKTIVLDSKSMSYVLKQLYIEQTKLREAFPQVEEILGNFKNSHLRIEINNKILLALKK